MVPTGPAGIRRGGPCSARDRAVFRRGFSDEVGRRFSDGRRIGSGQPPAQHKSIAGGCLFPGARGHSAGQEPESRDTGVSLFAENGSHLAEADAAEGHAGHVDDPGSSGNAGNGSHLARADGADAVARQDGNPGSSGFHETGSHLAGAGAAEGLAGGVPPGVNENGRVGRWDFGKGKARAALSARKSRQRYMAICPVKTAFLRTKCVPEPFGRRNAPLPGQKPDVQTRQCSSTAGRTGALFNKSPMLPLPTWGTHGSHGGWQISV